MKNHNYCNKKEVGDYLRTRYSKLSQEKEQATDQGDNITARVKGAQMSELNSLAAALEVSLISKKDGK